MSEESRWERFKWIMIDHIVPILKVSCYVFVLLVSFSYFGMLYYGQTTRTVIYDESVTYTGKLISVEYLKPWVFVISDTRLWFADGINFTISGQYEYLLGSNYTVCYYHYLANVTTLLQVFPFPSIQTPIRQEFQFSVINITEAEP